MSRLKAWIIRILSRRKFLSFGWMASIAGSQLVDGAWRFILEFGTPVLVFVISAIANALKERLDPRPHWRPTDDDWRYPDDDYRPPRPDDKRNRPWWKRW